MEKLLNVSVQWDNLRYRSHWPCHGLKASIGPSHSCLGVKADECPATLTTADAQAHMNKHLLGAISRLWPQSEKAMPAVT